MFRKLIVILIILCSLLFYNFNFLGKYSKLVELAGIGIMLITTIIYSVYDDSYRFKHNFSVYILIILLSLPFSMYIASLFHYQNFNVTLFAQRGIYYYLLYFTLHQLKIKPQDFEKIFISLAVIYIVFYFIQYMIFPRILFNSTVFKDRGTIRIFIKGFSYVLICYFYVLQVLLQKNQLKYLMLFLVSLIVFILLGSRLLIFLILVVSMLNLIISKRIKSRLAIYSLAIIAVISLFFAFQNIFQELLSTTLSSKTEGLNNIRIKTSKYFLSSFFPNTSAYIFGNGASGANSEYSSVIDLLSKKFGFFLSDIGIIGNYVNYGIFFIIGILGILYKSLKLKIQPRYNYIKYYFVFIILGMIMAGGFGNSDFIVLFCITLYMLDVSNFNMSYENQNNLQSSEVDPVQVKIDDTT